MSAEALIWLWNNLKPEPFGVIPLNNLSGKTSVTSVKNYEQISSYNWLMEPYTDVQNPNPTMVVPGAPKESIYWNGGKLPLDEGYMIYDANHLRYPIGPMDPIFQAVRVTQKKLGKPEVDFHQYDFVTDCINLQKIFAFCKGDEEGGLFRIDLERVGNMVIASRVEGSDVVEIDYDCYDQNLKNHCSKSLNAAVEGPFQQIVQYQFGQLKLMVRFEPDFADYTKSTGYSAGDGGTSSSSTDDHEEKAAGDAAVADAHPPPSLDNRTMLPESKFLRYVEYGAAAGDPKKNCKYHFLTCTSFPQGKGFPSFTWAQLFFSGIDTLAVGWWKGKDDFTKPAHYTFNDVSKMIKPLPYAGLSKVHDFLLKILNFMRKNDQDLRVSLLWKGGDFIEIYEKSPQADGILTDGMKNYLKSQVKSSE